MNRGDAGEDPRFSLVIPVYNEAENVLPLAAEIAAALEGQVTWECLWVDDGSRDEGAGILRDLGASDKRHRVLTLERNSGQSAALLAGFQQARGGILGTLDADGQNVPGDLPAMLRLLEECGADLVNGRRARRQDSWLRRVSSRLANSWRNTLTGETVADVGCAIRVFRRDCVRQLPPFKGMHRFLPTLIKLDGWSLVEMPVAHRPRERGVSKYGVGNRLWVGIADTFGIMWLKRRYASHRIRQEEK